MLGQSINKERASGAGTTQTARGLKAGVKKTHIELSVIQHGGGGAVDSLPMDYKEEKIEMKIKKR